MTNTVSLKKKQSFDRKAARLNMEMLKAQVAAMRLADERAENHGNESKVIDKQISHVRE
ncbi:MAG: hypothetical protein IKS23_03420 [Alphaproteobacteria bacterium]|nr:hypothetical protein [Alphaproteobacteria bacterium]